MSKFFYQIARALGESSVRGPWKLYECWFIPIAQDKIVWLLVNNNIYAKSWLSFHWCGHLPLYCFQSRGGPPARVSFKLLNFLSGIIEYLRSFSVRIRFTRRLSLSYFNPFSFPTNCSVNSDITLFMASSSYLLKIFAFFGSRRLTDI